MKVSPQKALRILTCSSTLNRPHHVQWFLTQKCNYRCRGCSVWRKKKTEELNTEQVKRGLDVLRELGVVEVVFSGGNPLLRSDIDEIIDYASRYFITTIYDNGSMALEKINALRKVDFLAISLDTLNAEKNDYIKGVPGSWKKSMEAIRTLHKKGIVVAVSPTISQLNIDEIVKFTDYFTRMGIPVLYCLYQYDQPEEEQLFSIGRRVNEFKIASKEKAAKVFEALLEMKKHREGIFVTEKMLNALREFFLRGRRTWKCRALQSFFMIDHLGRVAGCHVQKPVASIFELPEVWDSLRFEKLRKKYEKCTRCAYLCYIFYSLHSGVSGNVEILRDQWKNIRLLAP